MFKPVNRYIEIKVSSEPESPKTMSGILLPKDYEPNKEERYVVADILAWAEDVRFCSELTADSKIIIDRTMIENINVSGKHTQVILDNYVLGLIT